MTRTTAPAPRVAGKNGFSLISDDKFRELYGALLMCRMLDERMPAPVAFDSWKGLEAASAGVVACLQPGDSIVSSPRAVLAAYLHKKRLEPPAALSPMAYLSAATGEALRHKLEQRGNVAVVFANSGEPVRMREVFAAASGNSLPVFYVFESDPLLANVSGSIPVIRVDACDTVAAYRVAHEAIMRARDCGGPTIMECAAWPGVNEDPVKRLENYLAGKKLFHKSWKKRLEEQYAKSLEPIERAG